MIHETDLYNIGNLGRPHGLSGEITLICHDETGIELNGSFIWLRIDGLLVPFFIEGSRPHSNITAYIKIEGINSAEQAKKMNGLEVWKEKPFGEKQPQTRANVVENKNNVESFSGYIVYNAHDKVGTIVDVDTSTPNTLFILAMSDGQRMLVPAHNDLIVNIDHETRTLVMCLPDGLLTDRE